MLFQLNAFPRRQFGRELQLIILLALPMMVAQLAQVGMGFVDTVMAGQLGAQDLAAVGLGSSIFVTFYVTLIGIPTALNPILSHLFGAKRHEELAEEARQGIWLSLLLGLAAMVAMWLLTIPLRAKLQLHAYTVNTTVLYMFGVSLGLPAAIVQRALQAYTAALNRPQAVMWIGLVGLLLNIPLNYILMHGLFGMPRLGGAGCGFASAAVYWFNALVLWIYLSKSRYFKAFGLHQNWSLPRWSRIKPTLVLGFPISLSFFLEVSLFSFIALLIANLGEHYVAAQQVVIVITSMIYMLPQTLGAATSVRVGQTLGSGERVRAYYVSGVGLCAGIGGALITASLLIALREPLLHLFTQDSMVIATGMSLLLFAAVFQIADSTQTIASGALRGYKITKIPMLIHAIAFWMLGLGVGYALAFFAGWGLYGFWTALVISLTVAAFALTYYLVYVGRRRAAL
ncbi:MAG: MATE family efflux transporter [Neisseria sp.]|nr:MATE family efflux transporter [Neisseria sp.]